MYYQDDFWNRRCGTYAIMQNVPGSGWRTPGSRYGNGFVSGVPSYGYNSGFGSGFGSGFLDGFSDGLQTSITPFLYSLVTTSATTSTSTALSSSNLSSGLTVGLGNSHFGVAVTSTSGSAGAIYFVAPSTGTLQNLQFSVQGLITGSSSNSIPVTVYIGTASGNTITWVASSLTTSLVLTTTNTSPVAFFMSSSNTTSTVSVTAGQFIAVQLGGISTVTSPDLSTAPATVSISFSFQPAQVSSLTQQQQLLSLQTQQPQPVQPYYPYY